MPNENIATNPVVNTTTEPVNPNPAPVDPAPVADPESNTDPATQNESGEGQNKQEDGYTMNDLLAMIADLKAENTRNKKALDKATGEAADYKRKFQARQTEEERKQEEEIQKQTERAEYVKGLEDFKKNQLAYNRYIGAGYKPSVAQKMADAEVKGDFDALNGLYKQVLNEQVKEKEKELRAQSISGVNVGNSEGEVDQFLVGWNSVK